MRRGWMCERCQNILHFFAQRYDDKQAGQDHQGRQNEEPEPALPEQVLHRPTTTRGQCRSRQIAERSQGCVVGSPYDLASIVVR